MKAIKLAAMLLLAGGGAVAAPEMTAQVYQADAEFNAIPDKVTPTDAGCRIAVCLVGIPSTAQTINAVELVVGNQKIAATDIDPIDFERPFQFEDTGVVVLELDFPYQGKLPASSTLIFHTAKGDVVCPARQ